MQMRELGSSRIQASAIAYGAWAIGGWTWGSQDEQDAIRSVHAALDAGINFIDTAPIYGFGTSEELLGRALKGRRDQVVLASKCGMVWNTEKGDFFFHSSEKNFSKTPSKYKVMKYLGPESIRRECEDSLRRLDTDVIDLYQTHWQESTTPIADSMAELLKLKDEGKIRSIGVSNATCEQMDEYWRVAKAQSNGSIDSDQERYSMLDRKHEGENLPYVIDKNMAFLAYSPLAMGLLTGKMDENYTFDEGDQRNTNPRFSVENRKKVRAMLDAFQPVADKHDLTMAQLVIAWTIAQPGCSHALVGARNEKQARENAAAGAVELSDEDIKTITDALDKHGPEIK
jgi:aryl-alcohol dehydrogenase-like predicted oxidoreductase